MRTKKFMFGLVMMAALVTCFPLPAHAVFTAVTNTDKISLLAEPTPTSTIVEVLSLGDVVKVFKKSTDGQYWEVEHKGNHGWIIFKYLSPKDHRYSTEV